MDKDLAYGGVAGTVTNVQVFAGDAPIITEEAIVTSGNNLAKYTVVAKITASGKIKAYTPGASDGSQFPIGVLTQAADATSADVRAAIYTSGFFNDAILVWPSNAACDTLIERQALFAGKDIRIGTVRL